MTSSAVRDAPAAALVGRRLRVMPKRPMIVTFGSITNPDGGLQVRSRVLAESLTSLGIPPAIVSTREPARAGVVPGWARALHVPPHKPTKGFSIEFSRLIHDVARDSDVVIVANAMFMPALAAARVRLPVIWDTNECQSLHYSRLSPSLDVVARRLAWSGLERWAAHRCDVAVSIGEPEAREWRRRYASLRNKTSTVDHVAFTPYVLPRATRGPVERLVGGPITGTMLVFVGTMTAKHNRAAARWIVDVLAPSLNDDVTIVLCGPGSDQFGGPGRGARVIGLGMVDDVDAVVAAADLCLAPLASGAGVKTKVLHYLAHGQRVAGTRVAFEGLEGAPGLISAPLSKLPGVVARLIDEPETEVAASLRVTEQARWMARLHARERVVDQWREVLEGLNRV